MGCLRGSKFTCIFFPHPSNKRVFHDFLPSLLDVGEPCLTNESKLVISVTLRTTCCNAQAKPRAVSRIALTG